MSHESAHAHAHAHVHAHTSEHGHPHEHAHAHGGQPAGDGAPQGLSASLRALTALHHRGAEQGGFMQLLAGGRLPHETFTAWLEQMHAVYASLEAALAAAGPEALGGFPFQDWRRTPQLAADLAHWDSAPDRHASLPAVRAFQERLAAWSTRPTQLLGALYVLEGSSNGGRMIAAALRKAWQLEGSAGLSFLDPHGEAQHSQWATFKQQLDQAVPLSEGIALVEAAQATFEAMGALGHDLLVDAAL